MTPADAEPTADAVTHWGMPYEPPSGDDPLDALIVRLAAAREEPGLLKFHLDDVGSAAGRAAVLSDPGLRASTQGEGLTAGDHLTAYVLEWTLHHLDLAPRLPDVPGPPAEAQTHSRATLERIAGTTFPVSFSDEDALPRRKGAVAPYEGGAGRARERAERLPFVIGRRARRPFSRRRGRRPAPWRSARPLPPGSVRRSSSARRWTCRRT